MRTFRVLALVIAVALLVASPSVFASTAASRTDELSTASSKVCHPKNPVTCRAADLSSLAVTGDASSPAESESVATDSRFESKQAMACHGGIRWACKAPTLSLKAAIAPRFEFKQAMACNGGIRWACKATTL